MSRCLDDPGLPGAGSSDRGAPCVGMLAGLVPIGVRRPDLPGVAPPRQQIAPPEPPSFVPGEEQPEEFPAGPGRDETFYACTACHNFKLVAAQGMSRRQWERFDRLDDDAARHAAARRQGARDASSTISKAAFPPRAPAAARGGWQNPFLRP